MAVTYLRWRNMFVAVSNMAVGLAIFRPTAWAKGWRAPWGDRTSSMLGKCLACSLLGRMNERIMGIQLTLPLQPELTVSNTAYSAL